MDDAYGTATQRAAAMMGSYPPFYYYLPPPLTTPAGLNYPGAPALAGAPGMYPPSPGAAMPLYGGMPQLVRSPRHGVHCSKCLANVSVRLRGVRSVAGGAVPVDGSC
jgi:hypothetical protein